MYVLTPSFTTGAPAARWPPTSFCPALAPLSQYNQRIFIYDVQEADGSRTLQPGNNHNNKKNVERLASESISLADTVRPEPRPTAPQEKGLKTRRGSRLLKNEITNRCLPEEEEYDDGRHQQADGEAQPKWRPLIRPAPIVINY